jgi:aryl-alcohol dehydrogenase-like predicted oxidoreductase
MDGIGEDIAVRLPRRRLGRNGPEITVLGAGSWAIGGGDWAYGWGAQDDAKSVDAIRHAVEVGVDWVDTAAVYGLGHSEEVVGTALRAIPAAERPRIFTKCGLRWSDADRRKDPSHDLRPESIRHECEASLRRLGVERIDLYQFHWPDTIGTPVEDSWGEVGRLIDEGKVAHGGVSNFDTALLERCERVRHVDSLQPPFSMIYRQAGADVIPWCTAHGTGVIVYSPMQMGLLTDSFGRDRIERMDPGDWRLQVPEFKEPDLTRNLALRDALRPIAARHGTTVAAVALAWVAAWPGITGAIVGARAPEQVDGWIGGATLELTAEDLDQIAVAIERTGAGAGPARPLSGTGGH